MFAAVDLPGFAFQKIYSTIEIKKLYGMVMKIILGSSSKQRQEMLSVMGYEFEVIRSDIDEKSIRRDDPKELVLAVAIAKNNALRERLAEPCLLITADTVVMWNGTLREKPKDAAEARHFLETASEYPSEVYTALVVTNTKTRKIVCGADMARVFFRKIPDTHIEELIRQGDIFGYAGGFAIGHPLIASSVASVEGARGTVMGLTEELTKKLINEVSE